ncbi:Capsanthin/capsorubin synthase, chromoplastic [Vitis vinifera]|uniref:Capsanthin/capsorubin synthase, chromoplastic n=1 Tax=Vitis vinifera TaxID=29760 RepID=A0A438HQA6_VITVI|nr:Capsanthin/capsorubin synthase, chromoplastic [Vitis vinifera]
MVKREVSSLFNYTDGTLLWPPPPPPPPSVISVSGRRSLSTFPSCLPENRYSRGKVCSNIQSSKFDSFLDLKPESEAELLDFDLRWLDSSCKSCLDVIIIGAGPAGLRLAEQVSRYGIHVCCIDPSPLSITKYLDRAYGRVSRKRLKMKLLEICAAYGVQFHKAKVWKVEHQEFESLIAHGILAEVDSHPFDLDKMLLMDWRDSHLGNEPYIRAGNSSLPTFLYAMPFNSNLIFLEETSLVSRPMLSYKEVKRRMVARLRHLGIRVRRVIEDEKCLIPMGGPLPQIPQSVMAIGGTAGLVHPSTGYMVAKTMALAPVLAETIRECLGSSRMIRGKPLHHRVWNGLWPSERRGFFDAFFDLDPYYWQGFLSSRLSPRELALLSLSLFGRASNPSRFDIITKCPAPLVKMMGLEDRIHILHVCLKGEGMVVWRSEVVDKLVLVTRWWTRWGWTRWGGCGGWRWSISGWWTQGSGRGKGGVWGWWWSISGWWTQRRWTRVGRVWGLVVVYKWVVDSKEVYEEGRV